MFRSLMTRTIAVAVALVGVVSTASAAYEVKVTHASVGSATVGDNATNGGLKDVNLTSDTLDIQATAGGPLTLTIPAGTFTFTQLQTDSLSPGGSTLTWQYNITWVATGTPAVGTPAPSGALTLEFSRTNYLVPNGLSLMSVQDSTTFGGNSGGSHQADQGEANGNTLYASTPLTTLSGPTRFNPGTASNQALVFTNGAPYTLTAKITLNFAKSGDNIRGNGTIQLTSAVPVPAGLVMALTGLPALDEVDCRRR